MKSSSGSHSPLHMFLYKVYSFKHTVVHVVDAPVVMDSRLSIQVENMATMSNLEDLEVDLNGTTSNTHYE